MPTYEYQCSKCGHQMEAFQSMSEKPLLECPACHESSLTKILSATGFQLKGKGWYVTDYSKKGKEKSSAGSEGSNSAASTSETKSLEKSTKDTSSKDTSSKNSDGASS